MKSLNIKWFNFLTKSALIKMLSSPPTHPSLVQSVLKSPSEREYDKNST